MPRRPVWCLAPLLAPVLFAAACAAPPPPPGPPHPFDWPQWLGPDRNGVSKETGLLQDWPKGGPKLAWQAKGLGGGYSTPTVAAGRVYGMGYRGDQEVVWAVSEADGSPVWSVTIAKADKHVGYNEGSRCSPAVDGDRVYVLGVGSDLVCLRTADGKEVWRQNLKKNFGGHMMSGWGYSESPLVDGDKLICTPGGKDATLVALDKKTGSPVWKAQVPEGDGAAYSSAIAADVGGRREYIQFLGGGVVGVSADGKYLWRYNHPHNGTANCSTPVFHDDSVFAASSYGTGGGLARLTPSDDGVTAKEVYFTKHMKNHHGGMVLLDGCLYGSDEGELTCLDFKTGKVRWAERKAGKGSIAAADGRLYYRNEGGPVMLVEVNPDKYVEHGRFEPQPKSGKPSWPHPVIANGRLYIRDQDHLFCYDVKGR